MASLVATQSPFNSDKDLSDYCTQLDAPFNNTGDVPNSWLLEIAFRFGQVLHESKVHSMTSMS